MTSAEARNAVQARWKDVEDLADRRDVAMARAIGDLVEQVREHERLKVREALDTLVTARVRR